MEEEKPNNDLPDNDGSDAVDEKVDNTSQQEDSLFDHDEKKGDEKASDDSSEQGDKEGDSDKKEELKKKAPERYKFTTPEGVELNTEIINKFVAIAKEADLDNETAQKVVDLSIEWLNNQKLAYDEAVKQAEKEAVEAIDKHPVFSKKEEMAVINKAIEGYAGKMDDDAQKAFRDFVNTPMAGKSIPFLSLLHLVGKDISDDKFFEGGKDGKTVDKKSAQLDSMFPTSKSD